MKAAVGAVEAHLRAVEIQSLSWRNKSFTTHTNLPFTLKEIHKIKEQLSQGTTFTIASCLHEKEWAIFNIYAMRREVENMAEYRLTNDSRRSFLSKIQRKMDTYKI